jgi:hypothetical protein
MSESRPRCAADHVSRETDTGYRNHIRKPSSGKCPWPFEKEKGDKCLRSVWTASVDDLKSKLNQQKPDECTSYNQFLSEKSCAVSDAMLLTQRAECCSGIQKDELTCDPNYCLSSDSNDATIKKNCTDSLRKYCENPANFVNDACSKFKDIDSVEYNRAFVHACKRSSGDEWQKRCLCEKDKDTEPTKTAITNFKVSLARHWKFPPEVLTNETASSPQCLFRCGSSASCPEMSVAKCLKDLKIDNSGSVVQAGTFVESNRATCGDWRQGAYWPDNTTLALAAAAAVLFVLAVAMFRGGAAPKLPPVQTQTPTPSSTSPTTSKAEQGTVSLTTPVPTPPASSEGKARAPLPDDGFQIGDPSFDGLS